MDIYEFAAWAIDFEGAVIIGRSFNKLQNTHYYNGKVELYGCSQELLNRFAGRVGFGYVGDVRLREHGNDQFTWRLRVEEIKQHLPLIKDHLFLKKRQAELVLRLFEIQMPKETPAYKRAGYYSSATLDEMYSLHLECKSLNEKTVPIRSSEEEMYRLLRRR